ncbi:MAG TPA: peptidoglycan DD-metalloendopeptidase family protein [Allosphingosinicella sp.]
MRLWHAFSLASAVLAGGIALAQAPDADPQRLKSAVDDARQALARSRQFEQAAAQATDRAARARAEAEALAARIQASEAEITAAQTRVEMVDAALRDQRARLAERQGPLIRLTAALQTMSRRPPALALIQPGSIDDSVRVRSVLAATLPRIRARTAGVRAEIDRTRALRGQQDNARRGLLASRADLAARREALARLESEQRSRSQSMSELALVESDRALALGEEARSIERLVSDRGYQERLEASLATLPGPVLRPGAGGASPSGAPPFAMPVGGRVVTGVGELNEAGVHARGLTLAVEPGELVRAPAPGRVAFAGPFRSYGQVLIIDHGGGWTSVVTNLASLDVAVGQPLARGAAIGRTGAQAPRVTVELRFQGRPVPITALLTG